MAQFAERWLRDWADDNVSNKTWTRYAQLLRKHLCARVGTVPIQKLRAADLQAIYAAMAREGLADRTRLHLHRVRQHHAQARGPVGGRRAQRRNHGRRTEGQGDAKSKMLTPAQLQTVLETLRGKSLYPVGGDRARHRAEAR